MTSFGWALIAASLALMPPAAARAAGAFAIGACGAYGFAFDFAADPLARSAALRKCEGDCKVVAAVSRNCAAFAIDMQNACGSHGLCDRGEARAGAEQCAAAELPQWRQGLRCARLRVRRQRLILARRLDDSAIAWGRR